MRRPRIVIAGAGFAGFHAARTLVKLARRAAEIVLVNTTDYFLYLPLLPEVSAGILDPRRVTVPLTTPLPEVRLILGHADGIDVDRHRLHYTDPDGVAHEIEYDRLVLSVGSVNKLLPIPGIAEYARGYRGVPEALFLRDHLIREIEMADATEDIEQREARCTFVVVGAGYTGTEVAAHGQLFTEAIAERHPRLTAQPMRWMLLDIADRPLPELDPKLSAIADRVLRSRGIEVRMGTSVKEATPEGVVLTDGEMVRTRSLIWCVGVRPDPLVESLGLPTEKGRLVVDEYLTIPGHPEIYACGDAAAVPTGDGGVAPMTAQHAVRAGKLVARNIAASYGQGKRRPYRHTDLGFVVDLGGAQAAANPFGIPLSGLIAKTVTRGYHLFAMPGNRIRVAADWLLDALLPRQAVQLGLIPPQAVPLDRASPETIATGMPSS